MQIITIVNSKPHKLPDSSILNFDETTFCSPSPCSNFQFVKMLHAKRVTFFYWLVDEFGRVQFVNMLRIKGITIINCWIVQLGETQFGRVVQLARYNFKDNILDGFLIKQYGIFRFKKINWLCIKHSIELKKYCKQLILWIQILNHHRDRQYI